MLEIVNRLIELSKHNGNNPTLLSLDPESYNAFLQEAMTFNTISPILSYKDGLECYNYMDVQIRIKLKAKTWNDKINIELE